LRQDCKRVAAFLEHTRLLREDRLAGTSGAP
jgi:hypothetical protein